MNSLDWLQTRKNELEEAQNEAMHILQKQCDDSLIITERKGRFYYCIRKRGTDAKKYISQNEIGAAVEIAEHDYALRLLQASRKELTHIDKLLEIYQSTTAYECYELLHPGRQALVTPLLLSDAAFATAWSSSKSQLSNPHPVSGEFYTDNGEHVRSKSELIIANALKIHNVPYKYEEPLLLDRRQVFPDFTILQVGTRKVWYWEHFGLIDQPQYQQHMLQKIEFYASNGIVEGKNFIATYESKDNPISTKVIETIIGAHFGKG